MYIKLSNYRQHSGIELDFPETGLVLISGVSGSGKSSIFSAVYDALYGKERRVKPWAGGKPVVHLSIAGMEITRTRNPKSLVVNYQGNEFKDAAAEKEIQNVLGMQQHEFMACSYVLQKMSKSLLNLEPAEMMQFITRLSAKKINPEVIKNEIKEKVKNRKPELRTAQSLYEQAKQSHESILEAKIEAPIEPQPPCEISSFDYFRNKSKTLQEDILKANRVVSDLDKEKKKHEELREAVQSSEIDLQRSRAEFEKVENPTDQGEELRKKLQVYKDKTEYLNVFGKITALATKVHSQFPESKTFNGKLSVFISEKIAQCNEMITKMNQQISEAKSEINNIVKWEAEKLTCPKCSAVLKMSDSKLIEHEHAGNSDKELVTSLLKQQEESIKLRDKHQADLKCLQAIQQESTFLVSKLGKDPLPEIKDIVEVSNTVISIDREIKENKDKVAKYYDAKTSYSVAKAKHEGLLGEFSDFDEGRHKEARASAINEIEAKELELTEVDKMVALIGEYEVKKMMYNKDLENIARYQASVDRAKKVELESAESLKVAHDKLAAAERSKEVIEYAAALAIEEKIEEINSAATKFVDRMFSNDGTSIRLTNFSTTSTGEERSKIGIEIIHKGQKISSLSEFSGGEESRACLCFQLGLSELYNSPILMIDEGFTGLNPELQEECLMILQEVASDKLIIVAEHGAPEHFFDKVIRI